MCCAHVVEKSLLHQNVKGFYSKMHHYLVISFQIEDFATFHNFSARRLLKTPVLSCFEIITSATVYISL